MTARTLTTTYLAGSFLAAFMASAIAIGLSAANEHYAKQERQNQEAFVSFRSAHSEQ